MPDRAQRLLVKAVISLLCLAATVWAADRLRLQHADRWEVVFERGQEIHYVTGNVIFETETGIIYADSAIWVRGKEIVLQGRVIIDDSSYYLVADSVLYSLAADTAVATGDYVELWSKQDSLFATGQHAWLNRETGSYQMEKRPTLLIGYPDSSTMIEVTADEIEYADSTQIAQADGNVVITTQDTRAQSGCAIFDRKRDILDLYEEPRVKRGESVIIGQLITIAMAGKGLRQIDVVDSARADLKEPVDTTNTEFDESRLQGKRIIFDFVDGDLRHITTWGESYSWYYPSSRGRDEYSENTVSGDTIYFDIRDKRLNKVTVVGGAVGSYLTGKTETTDSGFVRSIDTIDYKGEHISYSLEDSVIVLTKAAHVTSGDVVLDAYQVRFDTEKDIIYAYSGEVTPDTVGDEYSLTRILQPNAIPVVLKDGEQELFGDFLEYSLDTEKGRIVESKSDYETGYYYGDRVFRANKQIYYVEDGRYTTCNLEEPHFHFYSKNMKLIEGDKLMARPVVMYLGRLPIFALPYYVFPLKKGRHSGFLPFTLGNIESGDRFIRNVGYYWAASEYWDLQGAMDYYERARTINLFGRVNWRKRYVYGGSFSLNYARETDFSSLSGYESRSRRWAIRGSHDHTFTPTFKIAATGEYQSDATYYNDFSPDLEDRLNRTTRSQLTFQKRFGRSVSLSGQFSHDVNLDLQSRTDFLPSAGLTLPAWHPFGSNAGAGKTRFYNSIVVTYRPRVLNYSNRITLDSLLPPVYQVDTIPDTVIVIDTITGGADTTITDVIDSTLISQDTISYRSRKEYSRMDHNVTLRAPLKFFRYVVFNPGMSYNESWYKIWETDQSQAAGIDPSRTYRTFNYSFGASMNTKLYGTVYPNILGLIGLRQVVSPSVGYSFTPELERYPEITSYAGGTAGTTARRSVLNMSVNHLYQAKVHSGDAERNLELISISHSLSYNFEDTERPYSNLTTSFQSSVLPNVNIYGDMVHSLYKPGTNELHLLSPYLESFRFNTSLSLVGRRSIFDAEERTLQGVDSASQLSQQTGGVAPAASRGWNLALNYTFDQRGRGDALTKNSFLSLLLRFNLTPTTAVTYSQNYNFDRKRTVNSQVSIVKNLHCWTGTFFWIPTGSRAGYGFRIWVNAIPDIKIENSQNPLSTSYFQDFSR